MRMSTLWVGMLLALTLPALAAAEPPAQPAKKYSSAGAARGVNEFAFDLYRQLAKEAKPDQNIFFSPYSISAAFAMTYAGARGETAAEMQKVLRFHSDQEQFHPAFARLSKDLRIAGPDSKFEINIANSIWTNVHIREDFKRIIDAHYQAGLRPINFNRGEEARSEINEWVSEKTRQRIQQLLPLGSIDRSTALVLTNAVYFHAEWQVRFGKSDTTEEKFFRAAHDVVTAQMMHLHNTELLYARFDDAEIVELPYWGQKFRALIILPVSHDRFSTIVGNLSKLAEWIEKLQKTEVDLAMPRVKLAERIQLRDALRAMGMQVLFSKGADLSRISEACPGLNQVYHMATLKVDEVGTTAAAATAASAKFSPRRLVRMTVNRPFLFLVRDADQGLVLFFGRVMTPI